MKPIMKVLFGMTLLTSAAFGQDVITKTNGDAINARVIEMNANVIKYKAYNTSSDSVYTIAKNEVFMIKYENGSKTIVYQEKENTSADLAFSKIEIIGKAFYHNRIPIKGRELKELLAQPNDSIINKQLKKARSKNTAALVLGITSIVTAGGLVGIPLGITAACIAGSSGKNIRIAVARYNEIIDQGHQENNNSSKKISSLR